MSQEVVLDQHLGFQRIAKSHSTEEILGKQNAQLRVLLEVSRHLNSTLDLDTLLECIIQVATEVTDTAESSILLLDSQSGQLHFEAATGFQRAEMKAIAVPLEGSIAGWIFTHNKPQVVHDTRQDTRHYGQVDSQTKFTTQSILGVPLQVKEKTIGVLEVVNKRGGYGFSKQDLEILETLAAQAAVAIENARLYQELQHQMETLQQAQDRLIQSEKLVAIGELVAGVAHELNNPLTAIIGFAELLQATVQDETSADDLRRIVTQGQRATSIVRNLLDFARQRQSEKRAVQINEVIKQTIDLFSYELRSHNVTLKTNFSSDLPMIMADPQQLQQVLINLINNARQAMAETNNEGTITIATRAKSTRFDSCSTTSRSKTSGQPAVCISITDDGPGIPPDLLSRIFDPFFTTKEPGKGTGLGLSVCHGIISKHNGRIWVESNPNQGATFFIDLPVSGSTSPEPVRLFQNSTTVRPVSEPAATEKDTRILIIDDESDIIALLIRVLSEAGYQVDGVSNGRAALACIAEIDYDLILCDVRMPDLSGQDIYEQACRRRPAFAERFMFITGDTIGLSTDYFLEKRNLPYLSKPFEAAHILKQIQQKTG